MTEHRIITDSSVLRMKNPNPPMKITELSIMIDTNYSHSANACALIEVTISHFVTSFNLENLRKARGGISVAETGMIIDAII